MSHKDPAQDLNQDKKLPDNPQKKDEAQFDAPDSARQAAIAKMKAAQLESSELSTGDDDDESGIEVKESNIDPKAQKTLSDLLGGNSQKIASSIKQVKVYTPFRIYYDNEASSVSAINGTGPFDILPGHKNFLSLLAAGDIVVRSVGGKEERITVERGVMHVHNDTVKVFLDV